MADHLEKRQGEETPGRERNRFLRDAEEIT